MNEDTLLKLEQELEVLSQTHRNDMIVDVARRILALNPKEFKTGSRGFFASTKAEIKNKRYQIQIQAVEIGSKKASEENK